MTAHPIDTEALRKQYAHLVEKYGFEAWAESRAHVVLSLLDALADAEQRATRAEEKVSEQKALRMKAVAAVTEAEVREEQLLLRNRNLLDALKQAEADRDWLFRSSRLSKMERIKANARAEKAESQIEAVRGVLDNIDTSSDPALHDGFADILRALDGDA